MRPYVPFHIQESIRGGIISVLFQIGFAGEFQLIIPLLAEMRRQRPFEELIESYSKLPTKLLGRLAYLPAVIIDSRETRIDRQSHRIQRTRRRLTERPRLALVERTFNRALAQATGSIAGIDTIASIDNLRHKVTVRVKIARSLLGNALLRRRKQLILKARQQAVNLIPLA